MSKTNTNTTAWWVLGLSSLVIYLKHRIDSIAIRLRNLSLVSYDQGTKTAELNLIVAVHYPLPFDTLAKRLTGTLYIQGQPVATVDTMLNRYLKTDAENLLTIPATVRLDNLAAGVWANIQTGNVRTLQVQLDARLTTNLLPINIHRVLTWDELTA